MIYEPAKKCVHCGEPAFGGCRECTRCWELSRRIESDPKWARHFQASAALSEEGRDRIERVEVHGQPDRELVLSLALAAMRTPEANWRHPAQADALADVGRFFSLVLAGCRFERVPKHDSGQLVCFVVHWRGADWHANAKHEEESFWLPRPSLLAASPGADWYSSTAADELNVLREQLRPDF